MEDPECDNTINHNINNNTNIKNVSYHVNKVYDIVMRSILVYALACALNCGLMTYVAETELNMFLLKALIVVSIVVSFVTIFMIVFSKTERDKRFWTDMLSGSLGISSSPLIYVAYAMDPSIIVFSTLGTLIIFLTFTFGSKFIKDENTAVMGSFLFSVLNGLVILGLVFLFWGPSQNVEIIYLLTGLLLFCGYIAFDTKMMYMRFRDQNGNHDHYLHAINIFLDIINVFVKLVRLLMILADKKDNKKKR